MFSVNWNYFKERILLRKCAEDDALAQREFADLSYLNTIHRCVHEENARYNRPLTEAELANVFMLIVTEVYLSHNKMPSVRSNLYARVTAYASHATLLAIKRKTEGQNVAKAYE